MKKMNGEEVWVNGEFYPEDFSFIDHSKSWSDQLTDLMEWFENRIFYVKDGVLYTESGDPICEWEE